MGAQWRMAAAALLLPAALGLAACGSTAVLPEAATGSPLKADNVTITQTGNAPATIDQSSVTFVVDDSGTLVITLSLTSQAATSQTVAVRASLLDSSGAVIGDVATGGEIGVLPYVPTRVQLTGTPPNGTIAAATFEVTAQASPTPTAPGV